MEVVEGMGTLRPKVGALLFLSKHEWREDPGGQTRG